VYYFLAPLDPSMAAPVLVPIIVSAGATIALAQGALVAAGPLFVHGFRGFGASVEPLSEAQLTAMHVVRREESLAYRVDTDTYTLELRYFFHETEFESDSTVPPISSMLF
jgi:hypothetical protein